MSCDIDFWPNIDYLATKSPTIGTRKISYRFETDFVASMTVPVPERDSSLSRLIGRMGDAMKPVEQARVERRLATTNL
jgi:hypothetical protein